MIEKIKINHYRKLKNVELNFKKGVNAISGTNGTCKTSILHLFSNSFQAVTSKSEWVKDTNALSVIRAINSLINPKIESLTRGDKIYNDPAYGVKGDLFEVEYFNNENLSFRRHNSAVNSRYAVKPKYRKDSNEKLPYCPVIYLGLSRLVPFGEYKQDDSTISNIKRRLPSKYQKKLSSLYKSFTSYSITYGHQQAMGTIKKRLDFVSEKEGIDSNTISAGEDNLMIILTALISLEYYYDSINNTRDVESVLLIDEIDATLHPSYQIKLLELFVKFSQEYKIQVVFTTHSISLLEKIFEKKENVFYFFDNITGVLLMEEPDIYKVKMYLKSSTEKDIYMDRVIPIFTEDKEARYLLELVFSRFSDEQDDFSSIKRFFHFVDTNIGAKDLIGIFKDSKLLRTTMNSICILDGDHNPDIGNCIISLPGKDSPEEFLLLYAKSLYDKDDEFWTSRTVVDRYLGKQYYLEKIKKEVDDFEKKNNESDNRSSKGEKRTFNKKLFNDNIQFFELLFKHWLNNPDNEGELKIFYNDLKTLFKKVSRYNDINPNLWN